MMRRRSSTEVQGRPGVRQGWVQWRAIRCRCQRSSVSGLTSQPARRRRGRAAAIAPSRARSSSASAGRLFSRRRTVSWWRSTMISRSFERPERTVKRANEARNRYRMRHIGSQDASATCLVSAYDHILGTHTPAMRGIGKGCDTCGPRMEHVTPGQRPRPHYGHPQARFLCGTSTTNRLSHQ